MSMRASEGRREDDRSSTGDQTAKRKRFASKKCARMRQKAFKAELSRFLEDEEVDADDPLFTLVAVHEVLEGRVPGEVHRLQSSVEVGL